MVELSVQIEGFAGLTWHRWKRLVTEVERLGFAGLYCCDHFHIAGALDMPSLEMTVALTYAADHSSRMRLGPLVAPLSIRDPVMLARQAMALDDLSGGRMVLGVGAGWVEDEHTRYGYELGDTRTRIDRLAEGLEVITRLCRDPDPVSFEGRFYHLRQAKLTPRSPKPGGPTLMVAGKGLRRLLPLVARYADVWASSRLELEVFRERSAELDLLLDRQHRPRESVTRASMDVVACWRDEAELERRLGWLRTIMPERFGGLSTTDLRDALYQWIGRMIDGTPDHIVDQIQSYADAGLDELMIDWFDPDDIEGLEVLAAEVLPRVTAPRGASIA
jgi:alkanesulfonate monooxygenase SsuD/methylene tetrahydromethanopterin reductase-like flavin-dependent oxidoreductase (luciferase family)